MRVLHGRPSSGEPCILFSNPSSKAEKRHTGRCVSFLVGEDGFGTFSFPMGMKIKVLPPSRPAASNSPPDCCIS